MKVTIDLAQSPQALLNELTQAVRIALGPQFFIEESGNFSAEELKDPNVNVTAPAALGASNVSTLPLPAAASSGGAGSAVELDSEGHPHDIRIHSSGKSKIANGTWKLAKGMSDKKDYVAQINAQNKSLMATPLPTAAPGASNVVALPALAPVVAALPELPPVAQVAAPDVEIEVTDYPTFAAYVAQQMTVKPTHTKAELDKGLKHYGLVDAAGNADITALQHMPQAVMPLYQWLKVVIELSPAG